MDIGTVCEKTKGRDKGKKCVVVDLKENRILVTGPKPITGVRRREVNPSHLKPTSERLKIKKGATDEEVAAALGASLRPARPRAATPAPAPSKKAEHPQPEPKKEKKHKEKKPKKEKKHKEKKKPKEKKEKKAEKATKK